MALPVPVLKFFADGNRVETLKMGLTGWRPVFVAALTCVWMAAEVHAQSADTLAMPIRKSGSKTASSSASESKSDSIEKSESKESPSSNRKSSTVSSSQKSEPSAGRTAKGTDESSEKTRNSSSRSVASARNRADSDSRSQSESTKSRSDSSEEDADLAAVANLRTAGSTSERSSDTNTDSDEASESGDKNEDNESATEVVSVPGPATSIPELPYASTPTVTAPQPNMYVPQATTENRGLLSRLFGRKKVTPTSPARIPTNFTSDYTKRDPNLVLPAVLSGNGLNGKDIPIGSEDGYRLASALPTDFRPTDLVQIPKEYSHYGNQLYLRQEAAAALCSMIYDAQCQGLNIEVVSAFRDYGHQLRLYNQSVARRGPNQKMVAKPGKSEHFLGTTVDLTNSKEHALKRSFGETPEGKWLAANAHRYGWKMTVMSGEGRRSHNDEPWHLRYLGNTVNSYTRNSAVAQTQPQPQRRDVMGRIGRFLGLRR